MNVCNLRIIEVGESRRLVGSLPIGALAPTGCGSKQGGSSERTVPLSRTELAIAEAGELLARDRRSPEEMAELGWTNLARADGAAAAPDPPGRHRGLRGI